MISLPLTIARVGESTCSITSPNGSRTPVASKASRSAISASNLEKRSRPWEGAMAVSRAGSSAVASASVTLAPPRNGEGDRDAKRRGGGGRAERAWRRGGGGGGGGVGGGGGGGGRAQRAWRRGPPPPGFAWFPSPFRGGAARLA